ncbi:MAG: gamma-glutamyltranspeptidase/glutathione hydrolase [Planctomycetota bacterium]|jgi:gamma-glutamyltranspeptidase/glutathione hydrolase
MKIRLFALQKPHLVGAFLCLIILSGNIGAAQFAISSASPLATRAGVEILKNGGNAFDAAIAVTSVLAVVEPYSSGLGGGGFYLLHQQDKNRQIMLDARERAPFAGGRDMYLDAEGKVNKDLTRNGATSAGIPGIPAALEHLQRNYGRLSLPRNLAAAIDYAERGFEIDDYYRSVAEWRLDVLKRYPSTVKVLLDDGKVPAKNAVIRQTDLANTLRAIAIQGKAGFYQGAVARQLVDSVRANGGVWSLADLYQYELVEREPVRIRYGDADIIAASLPSSGGPVLAAIFNMLEQMEYDATDPVKSSHQLVEAMRRAFRDRAEYMGDVDFVEVPLQRLMSKQHAIDILKNYSPDRATDSAELRAVAAAEGGNDTTHFSIVDAEGNYVAATLSVNYPFGSGLIAEGTGVILNDEMDDFSASPGVPNARGLLGSEANAIAPGKRMLSSMTPAFVHAPDRSLVTGTPGGSWIITMQLLGILEFLHGGSAVDIVSRPRFHHQYDPDVIRYEEMAFDEATLNALKAKGHKLDIYPWRTGNMHSIIIDRKSGGLEAAADPRGEGLAIVAE